MQQNFKIFALALAATLLFSLSAAAQWSSSATAVYLDAVNANKSVGIGTSTPSAKLHVKAGNNPAKFESTSADSYVVFNTSTGYKGYAGVYNGDNDMDFGTGIGNSIGRVHLVTNAIPRLTVGNTGNVGIGAVPSLTYRLSISGSAFAVGSWISSDQRYKDNIQTYQNALEKVLALRGTEYTFRTEEFKDMNFQAGKQIGFIAQELRSVLPELVQEDNGFLAVNYDGVVPVLVEAMKEQQAQIREKEAAIAALESQVNTLEARLAKIEQMLAQNPSGESSNERIATTVGAASKKAEGCSVFPNPNQGNFMVRFPPVGFAKSAVVVVLDLHGREVARQSVENGASQVEVNLQGKPVGTYVCQLQVDGKMIASEQALMVR